MKKQKKGRPPMPLDQRKHRGNNLPIELWRWYKEEAESRSNAAGGNITAADVLREAAEWYRTLIEKGRGGDFEDVRKSLDVHFEKLS